MKTRAIPHYRAAMKAAKMIRQANSAAARRRRIHAWADEVRMMQQDRIR